MSEKSNLINGRKSNIAGTIEFGSVYAIKQDADNSLWLGTSGYGLIHLKINRDTGKLSLLFLEKFIFNNSNSGPANDIIYALADGDKGHLWIGCRYGGLSLLDKKQRYLKRLKHLLTTEVFPTMMYCRFLKTAATGFGSVPVMVSTG